MLYTFASNISYAYILNVEPSNLVFSKTYNTAFDDLTVTFTDQNGRPFEIENNFNLTLLINTKKWCVILSQTNNICHLQKFYHKKQLKQ